MLHDGPDSFHITKRPFSQVGNAVYEMQWVDNDQFGLEKLLRGHRDGSPIALAP